MTVFGQDIEPIQPILSDSITIDLNTANRIQRRLELCDLIEERLTVSKRLNVRQKRLIEAKDLLLQSKDNEIREYRDQIQDLTKALKWYQKKEILIPGAAAAGFVIGIILAK